MGQEGMIQSEWMHTNGKLGKRAQSGNNTRGPALYPMLSIAYSTSAQSPIRVLYN